MKRLVLVACLLLSLIVAAATTAAPVAAGEEWCDVDPVVLIVTPHGALVPVFANTGAAGLLNTPAALLSLLQTRATVRPGADGHSTLVDLAITVPNLPLLSWGSFPTRTTISSGPLGTGRVYGRATGTSGRAMHVVFTLPVA